MQKFMDKCRKNYDNMTPVQQRNLRHALKSLTMVPVVLAIIWYDDGWRKVAGLVLFALLFLTVFLIATLIGMGMKKVLGGGKRAESLGTSVAAALVLGFFVAIFLYICQVWGR